MLPLAALESAQSELTDWQGSGMSVLEVSHRGKDFVACAAEAEALLREVMGVPDNYSVLFLQLSLIHIGEAGGPPLAQATTEQVEARITLARRWLACA